MCVYYSSQLGKHGVYVVINGGVLSFFFSLSTSVCGVT